ncbi:MAG: serine hydrolase domain-containing protein [Myxococcota bacterium]
MSRLRRVFAVFIALPIAAAVACAPNRETTPPRPKLVAKVPPKDTAADAELAERLARLSERLEKARVEHHVPGMSLAVVKDDRVVFAHGFGFADVADERAADEETLYAIGSSSKAFTSALVGTFVDEGKLAWDDPIEKHVPEMKLKVRRTDREPTLRDAMCHRTGFTRMGVLWAGGGVTREVMFATASKAEPWADYGKTFLYNNVVYATGGEAAARAGGKSWAALIEERFFEPLNMASSSTSIKALDGDARRAQGYNYNDTSGEFEPVPMRNLDIIGPAGSINSNVVDMAQWLRLQLGKGEVDGTRVISEERLADTWTPQIEVGGGAKYGLGWFVRDWKGHRVVEHGGNIDGFSAAVALMPDDGLGFVLLTNVGGTALQSGVRSIVWQSMLEPLDPPKSDAPTLDPAPFVGKYVADFGPWDDQRFTVTAQGTRLFVDVPLQTNYELRAPDGDGKWKFEIAPQIAASFVREEGGKATVMRLHQGGVDFELPREGWTPPAEIDLEAHRGHLGRFAAEDGKTSATVLVRGTRLAVDIPGQMVYELHKPDADGLWRFRIKHDIGVSFEFGTRKRDKKKVVAMTLHQAGTKTRLVRKAAAEPLLTLAELSKLRGEAKREAAIEKLGLLEATGTVHWAQSGIDGTVRIYFDAKRVRTEVDLGPFGTIIDVDNGERAWGGGSIRPVSEQHGRYLAQARQSHPLTMVRELGRTFTETTIAGRSDVDGASRIRVALRSGELPTVDVLIDPKTGDVVQSKTSQLLPTGGGLPITQTLGDHRDVFGLRFPFSLRTEDMASGRTIVEITSVVRSSADPAKLFPAAPPQQ